MGGWQNCGNAVPDGFECRGKGALGDGHFSGTWVCKTLGLEIDLDEALLHIADWATHVVAVGPELPLNLHSGQHTVDIQAIARLQVGIHFGENHES